MWIRLSGLVFLAAALGARTRDRASIFGTVDDAQGAAIPGATLTLTNVATGQVRSTLSDESGRYASNLPAVGSYRLAVEQAAFRRCEQTGILQQANENVKIDVKLEVGDVKTAVSVNAAASQIETQVATFKETVDRRGWWTCR